MFCHLKRQYFFIAVLWDTLHLVKKPKSEMEIKRIHGFTNITKKTPESAAYICILPPQLS